MLNIAEGSAKFCGKERRNFYIIARGSVFECTSLVNFLCHEREMLDVLNADINRDFESIPKMLYTMITNLDKQQ